MNAYTGQSYVLDEALMKDTAIGAPLPESFVGEVAMRLTQEQATVDELEAATAMAQGQPVIRTTAEVVQRLRIGDRELRRRRQRRR